MGGIVALALAQTGELRRYFSLGEEGADALRRGGEGQQANGFASPAFGIISAWSTYRLPFTEDIFQVELRSALGWQMLANLIAAVLCVSLATWNI